jgi:short-subunit dehydrogenase
MNNYKTALITGASRGIGYELARLFAKNSYHLVLISRNEGKLKEIQERFASEFKSEVIVIAKDLSLPNAAIEIFTELHNKEITVDVLINNAGIGVFGNFNDEGFHKVSQIMQINIVALTELTKLILKGMVERKEGKILNVSSLAAFQPGPYMAVYYASKAYVQSFSEAIACELKGTGVTVTTLCPGPTKSGFQFDVGSENSIISKLHFLSSAEDVAEYAYKELHAGKIIAIPGFFNTSIVYAAKIIPWKTGAGIIRKLQEFNRNEKIVKKIS